MTDMPTTGMGYCGARASSRKQRDKDELIRYCSDHEPYHTVPKSEKFILYLHCLPYIPK